MQKVRTLFNMKTLAVAVGGAVLGLAAAGAHAEVYGIATDQLTGVTVSTSSGTLTLATTPAPSRTSANSATYNGSGPSTSDLSTPPDPADAPVAYAGPSGAPAPYSENGGYTQGTTLSFTGGFGDSNVSGNPLTTTGSTANVTAQARLPGVEAGSASAQGRDAFAGNILLTLTGTTAATITLSFTSDLNLVASSDAASGSVKASSTARFTLTDMAGNTVLDFQPADLNQEISALGVQDTSLTPAAAFFTASTGLIDPGTYRLDLLVQANTSVSQAAAIPEPSSVLLIALGLTAAGVVTRRRKPQA